MTGRLIKVLVGLVAAAAAYLLVNISNEEDLAETAVRTGETGTGAQHLRYLVRCRALTTGEWYVHTSTDSLESAIAEAEILREKKPVRVIDSADGSTLYEVTETAEYREPPWK